MHGLKKVYPPITDLTTINFVNSHHRNEKIVQQLERLINPHHVRVKNSSILFLISARA